MLTFDILIGNIFAVILPCFAMLSVTILSVSMLNVIMLSIVILSVNMLC
jgi:hypothetical protein